MYTESVCFDNGKKTEKIVFYSKKIHEIFVTKMIKFAF